MMPSTSARVQDLSVSFKSKNPISIKSNQFFRNHELSEQWPKTGGEVSELSNQSWNLEKKNCTFFSLNLFSIPRDIPWHHWKNLLTSKRGRSGGLNFFTKFAQILLKTSGGSRNLNFDPICKCHTILETSWGPYEAQHNLIDLRGH